MIIPLFIAIAALCLFGFLATFETGTNLTWRIFYSAGILLCFAGGIATWVFTVPKND